MTATEPIDPSNASRMTPLRATVQIIGFACGVALLMWCARLALRDENRPYLERILNASLPEVALMIGLCIASLIANGFLFVLVIRPLYRVHAISMCATNAVATFLNNFPFKVSILARFLIHSRRDRLSLSTVFAWLAATAAVIFTVLIPPIASTLMNPAVDVKWWALTITGLVVCIVVLITISKLLARMMQRAIDGSSFFVKLLSRVHESPAMTAVPTAVVGGVAMRLIDTVLIALRFSLAARLAGVETQPGTIVLASSLYFLIGAITPAGAIGARDGGTFGILKFLPAAGVIKTEFAVVILTVTASEFVVNLCAAAVSSLYLRFSTSKPAVAVTPSTLH
jgi:hypothetical protein